VYFCFRYFTSIHSVTGSIIGEASQICGHTFFLPVYLSDTDDMLSPWCLCDTPHPVYVTGD
jgi:hypothetical protein